MRLEIDVLGASAVKTLTERTKNAVLTIGRDHLTRSDLATVECFNYVAAGNLSRALSDLGVKSTQDLFTTVPPAALAVPGLGAIALAVLGAAFEKYGLGGDAPLHAWMIKHRGDTDIKRAVITFTSLKQRESAELSREKKERRDRKRARRNTAHRLRTTRFADRAQA